MVRKGAPGQRKGVGGGRGARVEEAKEGRGVGKGTKGGGEGDERGWGGVVEDERGVGERGQS